MDLESGTGCCSHVYSTGIYIDTCYRAEICGSSGPQRRVYLPRGMANVRPSVYVLSNVRPSASLSLA